jgi:4-hydroxybenzoate polyprenyltransferase
VSEENSRFDRVLSETISRATAFFSKSQLPHGEFQTLLGSDRDMSNAVPDSGPFVTCFVLYALGHVEGAELGRMKHAALRFIASEQEFGGVWRYYGRRQFKHCRIPPDLDDTACASYALKSNHWPTPWNKWIFRTNRDSQGRFLTWIVPKGDAAFVSPLSLVRRLGDLQAKKALRQTVRPTHASDPRLLLTDVDRVPASDVDPVVAANAILYLGENRDTLPAISWLIDELRESRGDFSLYYKNPLALYYMVSRAHRHSSPKLVNARDDILLKIEHLRRDDGSFGCELSTALAACTLLTFDPNSSALPGAINAIVNAQRPDGSWAAHPFYSGPTEFWGSPELTTAFCLEALARFRVRLSADAPELQSQDQSSALKGEETYHAQTGWPNLRNMFIRTGEWWLHKIPYCILIFALVIEPPLTWKILTQLAVLVVIVSAVANYGHAINELFDRDEDAKVKKENVAALIGPGRVGSAAATSAGLALLLSYVFSGGVAALLTMCALLLPGLYSIPPVRLKARGWWGVFADALAAHVYPAVLAIVLAASASASPWNADGRVLSVTVLWSLLAGLRGILSHQVAAEGLDSASGLKTVVHHLGAQRVIRLTLVAVLPFEVITLLWLESLLLAGGFVSAVTVLFVWKEFAQLALGQKRISFTPAALHTSPFADNAYYIVWGPLAALTGLALHDPAYATLVIGYALLFVPNLRQEWCALSRLFNELLWRKAPGAELPDHIGLIRSSGAFDAAWYLKRYPQTLADGLEPVEHYCTFGWRAGLDPNPNFSTLNYLERNPDIAAAQLNPLVHYLRHGAAEGRIVSHSRDD